MHVGAQGERRVGVAEPCSNLLHVPASLEQDRGTRMTESVEGDPPVPPTSVVIPAEADALRRGAEHPPTEVAVIQPMAVGAREHPSGSRLIGPYRPKPARHASR